MNMDRRRSSLVVGSRTRKNVLEGKNVRKNIDGADNFADYWTDDDTSTRSSDSNEDLDSMSRIQQISVSNTTHVASKQNMARSQDSKVSNFQMETKNKSRQDQSMHSKSPLKISKSNVSSHENIDRSPAKKLKLFQNVQQNMQQYFTRSSNISGSVSSPNEKKYESSNSSQHLTPSRYVTREQSKNFAVSPLFKSRDKVKRALTLKNVQSSNDLNENVKSPAKKLKLSQKVQQDRHNGSINKSITGSLSSPVEKDNYESLHISKHVASSTYITKGQSKNDAVSPLSKITNEKQQDTLENDQSSENVIEDVYNEPSSISEDLTSNTYATRSQSKNVTVSPLSKTINKNILVTSKNDQISKSLYVGKHSTSDRNDTCKYTGNIVSPLPEKRKKRVVTQNAPNTNLNTSNIHVLSRKKIKHNAVNDVESEIYPVSEKTFNERYSIVNNIRTEHSSICMNSFETYKVRRIRDSLYMAKNFAKYDEYDADIMKMVNESKKTDKKVHSDSKKLLSPKQTRMKIPSKEGMLNDDKSQKPSKSKSSNKILTRSVHKNSGVTNAFNAGLPDKNIISEKGNFESENNRVDVLENTSHHSIQIENRLASNSVQNSGNFIEDGDINEQQIPEISSKLLHHKKKKTQSNTSIENHEFPKLTLKKITSKEKILNDDKSQKPSRFSNKLRTRSMQISSESTDVFNAGLPDNIISDKGNSESANNGVDVLENTLHHSIEIENRLALNSVQNLGNSTEDDGINEQQISEISSCGTKDNVHKIVLKRKSTRTSFVSSKKHVSSTDNVSGPHSPVKGLETFSKSNKSATQIAELLPEVVSRFNKKKKTHENKTDKNKDNSEMSQNDATAIDAEIPVLDNGIIPSIVNKKKTRVNKSKKDISVKDNNVQLQSPQEKKRMKKETAVCMPKDTNPVRRSTRQKFAPLAHWRGERLCYRFENGVINFVGVDKGTTEDDNAVKQLLQTLQKRYVQKKKKKAPGKFTVVDVNYQRKVNLHMLKKFDLVPWDDGVEMSYRIKRLFQTDNSVFGFIQIDIGAEKPLQVIPNEDLCLSVVKGKVEVILENNISTVEEKDMHIIPAGVPYKLKNIGSTKALLIFCVGTFNFLENEE